MSNYTLIYPINRAYIDTLDKCTTTMLPFHFIPHTHKGTTMTKKYFDLLEELDSKLSYIVDELEQLIEDEEGDQVRLDFIDELEHIRGVIND